MHAVQWASDVREIDVALVTLRTTTSTDVREIDITLVTLRTTTSVSTMTMAQ